MKNNFAYFAFAALMMVLSLPGCTAQSGSVKLTEQMLEEEFINNIQPGVDKMMQDEYVRVNGAEGFFRGGTDYMKSAVGDLNGDGIDDAVIQYAVSYGGNVSRSAFAVLIQKDGKLEMVAEKLMDGESLNQIKDQTIYFTSYRWAEDDPRAMPSIVTEERMALLDNELVWLQGE